MREMIMVWREEVPVMILGMSTGMQEKDTIMMMEETPMADMVKIIEEAEIDMKVGHLVCYTSN